MSGKSTVLVGIQYGDEGKARVLDKLLKSGEYGVVARFNGGANAGHTLEVDGVRIALHQVPSGIFYGDVLLYYGSGCVLHPEKMVDEITSIVEQGVVLKGRLVISPNVPLVKPSNIFFDQAHGGKIGTTGNGIGPTCSDVAIRTTNSCLRNIRIGDYLSNPPKYKAVVEELLVRAVEEQGLSGVDVKDEVDRFDKSVLELQEFVVADPLFLEKRVLVGENVFFEGANSTMLDPYYGTVPFVTSSRTLASAAYVGGDVSVVHHHTTFAVVKAIMSRVGNGPFVSEFGGRKSEEYCAQDGGYAYTKEVEFSEHPDPRVLLSSEDAFGMGKGLRMLGGEYGATTKRPRRIGAFDMVMIKQNAMINGVNGLFINKVDCLVDFKDTTLPGIPVVVAYELDGKVIDFMPTNEEELRRAVGVVEYVPFITQDITGMTRKDELPPEALGFVRFVEERTGVPVLGIGVGPQRDQFIMLRE